MDNLNDHLKYLLFSGASSTGFLEHFTNFHGLKKHHKAEIPKSITLV